MPIPKLDRMDRRILEEIQSDGSISNLELADRIGLSPSPCARRVKLLQESGIISRQITVLDQKKLGLPISIYISVSLDHQSPDRLANFDAKVTGWPEVVECSLITGSDTDYLLKVVGYVQDFQGTFSARQRHIHLLEKTLQYLESAKNNLKNLDVVFLAEDLYMAQLSLSNIIGKVSSDDLLGEIFSTFCIGK